MRIAISNARVAFAGGETWSLTAFSGLARRGHDVFLFCDPRSVLRRRGEAVAGGAVVPLRIRGDADAAAAARAVLLFRRHRIEIVCTNLKREIPVLGLAARLAGIPMVRRRGSDRAFRDSWRNRAAMRSLVAGLIVNSETTRRTVLGANRWIPEDRVTRIDNGIPETFRPDPEARARVRAALGFAPDQPVVGIVGVPSRRKGHGTLFEAAARLERSIPDLRILALGWSPETGGRDGEAGAIDAACERLGLRARTVFVPHVDDLNPYYNAIDVLAMPSTIEGFGYAAAEAMRAGTAVIASDASSLPEVVGENGETALVAPSGDVEAWAEAIRTLVTEPALRARIAEAGRRRIETRFSIDRMLEETEAYFARIVRERRTGSAVARGEGRRAGE